MTSEIVQTGNIENSNPNVSAHNTPKNIKPTKNNATTMSCMGNSKTRCTKSNSSANDFVPPNDELSEKIVKQVEMFFSDLNILKNKFLLKHVRRNKDGYVSLKLISSLRKVKSLTKDWRAVAYSMEKSEKLQMNEEKSKIRRTDALPPLDVSKTVLVYNLSKGAEDKDRLKLMLSKYGTIASILFSEEEEYSVILAIKKVIALNSDIPNKSFVVVEFESLIEAESGLSKCNSLSTREFNMIPICAIHSISKQVHDSQLQLASNHQERTRQKNNHNDETLQVTSIKIDTSSGDKKRRKRLRKKLSDGENSPTLPPINRLANLYSSPNPYLNSLYPYPKFIAPAYPILATKFKGDGLENTLWNQQQYFGKNRKFSGVFAIRQPRGPDGTNGFHVGRLRMRHQLI
ncbi:la-related protein 6-like [Uloborus diversus]|uniref:la-related protein 6-like n=1 Tax=Uloborus diversus TaxID=327109 RepID=UPI0024096778|nr:la-related protein 6-like [Uloborus diversus]